MAASHVLTTETVVVEEQVVFTLTTLCRASGAQAEQIQALIAEGLLQPMGPGPEQWQFSGQALPQTRTALRLARDFDLGLPGVAVVMDLLTEIDRLRSQLRNR